jgi:hypothetical protein
LDRLEPADADETSGGLYLEINETGVALKNLNLSPPRRRALKVAEGGDQHVIRRTIYSEPKHTWGCKMVMPIPDVEVDFGP